MADTNSFCGADCGAGVGRVSQNLLLHHFQEVDVVEPSHHYMESARKALSGSSAQSWPSQHKAVNFYEVGLENWTPHGERQETLCVMTEWPLLWCCSAAVLAHLLPGLLCGLSYTVIQSSMPESVLIASISWWQTVACAQPNRS